MAGYRKDRVAEDIKREIVRAMLGEDAAALLDAYGVEDVALVDLDLTPGLIERARAERGDAPLA